MNNDDIVLTVVCFANIAVALAIEYSGNAAEFMPVYNRSLSRRKSGINFPRQTIDSFGRSCTVKSEPKKKV